MSKPTPLPPPVALLGHLPRGCNGYVDESVRPRGYLLTCAVVPTDQVDLVRRHLRGLLLHGQRRVHFSKDSERAKQANLKAVADLSMVRYLTYRTTWTRQEKARELLVGALYRDAAFVRLGDLIFDWRQGQDHHDLTTIRRERRRLGEDGHDVRVDHLRSVDEPLLWLADAVGWAIGRGGPMTRLIEAAVTVQELEGP